MTPTDVEAAILAAMTGSVPKAERKLRQTTLQEEAAARAQMAEAEIATLMSMGMSRHEAWSEASRIFLKC